MSEEQAAAAAAEEAAAVASQEAAAAEEAAASEAAVAAAAAAKKADLNPLDQQINAKMKAPDLYKDKGYMKNIVDDKGETTAERLFKEVDELQTLKGKKYLPFDHANATEEEAQAHIDATKPENAEVYKVEGLVPPGKESAIQGIFHEAGAEPHKADKIIKGYLAYEQSEMAKLTNPEDFKEQLKTSFGDDFEAIAKGVGDAMKGVQSEDDQKIMGVMTNPQLSMVYRLVNTLVKDYGIDTKNIKTPLGGGGMGSVVDAQKEVKESYDALVTLKKKQFTKAQKTSAVKRYQDAQNNLRKLEAN